MSSLFLNAQRAAFDPDAGSAGAYVPDAPAGEVIALSSAQLAADVPVYGAAVDARCGLTRAELLALLMAEGPGDE